MKKRCSPECERTLPGYLGRTYLPQKCAQQISWIADNIRRSLPSGPRRHVKASETVNDEKTGTTLALSLADGQQTTDEAPTTQFCWFGPRCEEYLYWYFWDNPTHKYPFGEELDTPSIVEKMSSNTCQLREGKGESLTLRPEGRNFNLPLESFQNVFGEPGGEATNINTGNSLISCKPSYRMSPCKEGNIGEKGN
ncbi:hypothetical protein TNCV_278971 [Trichonephila clavipes]|nr:hypothetical protein TNCV_278971 [Trichonephila clavipes]